MKAKIVLCKNQYNEYYYKIEGLTKEQMNSLLSKNKTYDVDIKEE